MTTIQLYDPARMTPAQRRTEAVAWACTACAAVTRTRPPSAHPLRLTGTLALAVKDAYMPTPLTGVHRHDATNPSRGCIDGRTHR